MQNPYEAAEEANLEILELINARKWDDINYELKALIDADGLLLVKLEHDRFSLYDLAFIRGAPEEVLDVLKEHGFKPTAETRLLIQGKEARLAKPR